MPDTPETLAHALLDAARRAGAEAADALVVAGSALIIDTRGGTLEQAEREEGTEIGLRVLIGQRQATVSASDTSAETLAEMATRAVAMARLAPQDPHIGLADPSDLSRTRDAAALDLADPGPEPDPADLQDAALAAEAAARAVPGVSQVDGASAAFSRRSIHLAATNGFSGGYARTVHQRSCVAISGSGTAMERDHDHDARIHRTDLRPSEEIGELAGIRAVARHGATRPPTGRYPVLFDERIAGSLVSHLLSAINGQAIARGASWARDKLNRPVLPEALSLTEEPLRRRALASRPFDAEGLATARRTIVDRGILTGWTLDLATARKLGLRSTASATRSPGAPPSPSTSNIELTQGAASRDDLIRDMGTGLVVTSLIGATINPNTGDYSRGASGFWVRNGVISHPVNEATIAGNLIDMLARIIPANDARPHLSQVVPSLLVDGLTLAGA